MSLINKNPFLSMDYMLEGLVLCKIRIKDATTFLLFIGHGLGQYGLYPH